MSEENTAQDNGQTPTDSTQPPKPESPKPQIIEPEFDIITEGDDSPRETREDEG